MADWLSRVLGGKRKIPNKSSAEPIASLRSSSPPEPPPPESNDNNDQAEVYLERVEAKIGKLANDFANGAINQAQFQKLYKHYQNEIRTVNTLMAAAPDTDEWKQGVTEGASLLIRKQAMAKAEGYAIYENDSGMPLITLGDFKIDSALAIPMLSAYRAATREIFGGGMRSTELEGGGWLYFVPGEKTTMMAMFTSEPAGQQTDFLEKLHIVFEQANRNQLQSQPIDTDALVFPHEYFLGKGKK